MNLKADINRIYQSGNRFRREAIEFIACFNKLESSRLVVRVPKKVGNAPYRNRVKRVIREIFRLNRFKLDQSLDILITMKPSLERKIIKFDEVSELFNLFIARMNRLAR